MRAAGVKKVLRGAGRTAPSQTIKNRPTCAGGPVLLIENAFF
jgi:hypothetical protein